jgi:hypothetical protein
LRRPGEPHAHTGLYRYSCWALKDFGFRQHAGFVTRAGRDLVVALLMWRQGGGLGGAVTA